MENDVNFEMLSPAEQVKKMQNAIEQINKLETLIEQYNMSGFDVTELEAQKKVYEDFVKENAEYYFSIDGNREIKDDIETLLNEIELDEDESSIEAEQDVLDDEKERDTSLEDEELDETIEETGLEKDEAEEFIREDSEKNHTLDARAFEQSGIKSDEIVGNKNITSNYTFNDVVGLQYDSYKIIKTKTGYPVVIGITPEGTAERIPDDRLEINQTESKSMSLIRNDGSIKEVGLITSFRVKDPGSSVNKDQAIGLYNDNGSVNGFYARNAYGDRMIGEELPCNVYTHERMQTERVLDPTANKSIAPEADSAKLRTDDGCNDNIQNLGNGENSNMIVQKDKDELAEEYAEKYSIDKDELKERFDEELENSHSRNISDEQLMEEVAKEMDAEERHEPDFPSERTLGPRF